MAMLAMLVSEVAVHLACLACLLAKPSKQQGDGVYVEVYVWHDDCLSRPHLCKALPNPILMHHLVVEAPHLHLQGVLLVVRQEHRPTQRNVCECLLCGLLDPLSIHECVEPVGLTIMHGLEQTKFMFC